MRRFAFNTFLLGISSILACALLLVSGASADVVASTDFSNRVVSGKTSGNLTWVLNGIANPGGLTWVPESPQRTTSSGASLFDTANAAGHFAPARNILNQGAWSVSIPLSLTGSQITLEEVVLDWRHFNGSGNFQTINSLADWTVSITGATSGLITGSTETETTENAKFGSLTLTLATPLLLDNSESYTLKLYVIGNGYPSGGNNTGLDAISIHGQTGGGGADDTIPPSPDPMSFVAPPTASGQFTVSMTASAASDASGTEYLFTNTTLSTDSGWQDSPFWTDTGLTPNTDYSYTVKARDKSPAQNETAPSSAATTRTAPPLSGAGILETCFDGSLISGKTASNIPWATHGVADPGDLTWVPESPQTTPSASASLFDTSDTAGHFVPERNIDTEGAWSVSIPLVLTVPQIELGDVSLDWRHFNSSGNDQTASRSADWSVSVTGSVSGLIGSVSATGVSGLFGTTLLSFPSSLILDDSESYVLKIQVIGTGYPSGGNNTGLDCIRIGNTPPDTRPNILFLMTDDQRFDTLGCYGHPIIQTPVIDNLAAEGVRFTNAFVTTAICAASRASVLTGVTERTHGYTFGKPAVPSQLDATTYPKLLGAAGYRTGFIGKYGVSLATNATSHFDFVKGVAGYATSTPYFIKQPDGSYRHSTDVCSDKAIEFLESQNSNQPFCLSISFNAPHARDGASVAAESYPWPSSSDGLYLTEDMPDQGLNETWFNSQPAFVRNSINRNRYNLRWNTPEKYDAHMRAHLRMITGIDTAIGNILTSLQNEGYADNTIIVFTADNGLFIGARGFAGKWNHYEQSLRVPFIVYDPRLPEVKRGRVESAIALNIDLAPTFLDWAEEPANANYQGLSLVPIVEDTSEVTRTDFFCEHHMDSGSIPKWEGVRDERYVYANYYEENYEYLHDIQADPDQWVNLALDPAYQDVLDQMRARSATYQAVLQTRDSVAANEILVLDSEPDGLLDHWELEAFGNLSRDGLGDYDGDGESDEDEAIAGTDPNDPESKPSISITSDFMVEYSPYAPGRVFELQHTQSLLPESWTPRLQGPSYNGNRMEFDVSDLSGDREFFRMEVTSPVAP